MDLSAVRGLGLSYDSHSVLERLTVPIDVNKNYTYIHCKLVSIVLPPKSRPSIAVATGIQPTGLVV